MSTTREELWRTALELRTLSPCLRRIFLSCGQRMQRIPPQPQTPHISQSLSRHRHHRCIKRAIGAVLEQHGPDSCRPVPFTSHTLNAKQQNYAEYNLELLAIKDTLRAWRCYLHWHRFIIHRSPPAEVPRHPGPIFAIASAMGRASGRVRFHNRTCEWEVEPYRWCTLKAAKRHPQEHRTLKRFTKERPPEDIRDKRYIQNHRRSVHCKDVGERVRTRSRILECLPKPRWHCYGKIKLLYREDRHFIPRGQFRLNHLYDYHTAPCTGYLGKAKTRHCI